MRLRFAKWLIRQRVARRWTRKDLARHIGCAASQITRWEKGRSYPHLPQFAALMLVLAVDANAVLRMIPRDDGGDGDAGDGAAASP